MSDQDPTSGHAAGDPTVDVDDGLEPFDRLAQEYAARWRKGESPSIAEYEARYPDDAAKVRDLLTSVAMMERWKRGSQAPARSMPERLGEFRIVRELGRTT